MLIATKNNFDGTCDVLDTKDGVTETVSYDLLRLNPNVRVYGITSHDLEYDLMSAIRLSWSDNEDYFKVYYYDGFYLETNNSYQDDYDTINIGNLNLTKDELSDIVDIIQSRVKNKAIYPQINCYKNYPEEYEIESSVSEEGTVECSDGNLLSYFSILGIILDEKKSIRGIQEVNYRYVRINDNIIDSVDYLWYLYSNRVVDEELSESCTLHMNNDRVSNLVMGLNDWNIFINSNDYIKEDKFGMPLYNLVSNVRSCVDIPSNIGYLNNSESFIQRLDSNNYVVNGDKLGLEEAVKYKSLTYFTDLGKQLERDWEIYRTKMMLAGTKLPNFDEISGYKCIRLDYVDTNCEAEIKLGYGKSSLDVAFIDFHGDKLEIHNDSNSDKFSIEGIVSSRLTYVGWQVCELTGNLVLGNSNDRYRYEFRGNDFDDENVLINYIIKNAKEYNLFCNNDTLIPILFNSICQVIIEDDYYICPTVLCLSKPNLSNDKFGKGWDSEIGFGFVQVPVLALSSAIYEQGDIYVIKTALQSMYFKEEVLDKFAISLFYLYIPYSKLGESKKAKEFRKHMDRIVENSFKES